jgi:hypothetical protein
MLVSLSYQHDVISKRNQHDVMDNTEMIRVSVYYLGEDKEINISE